MKKLALTAGLVLAASVTFAPLAFAQDTGPATTACTDAKAAVVGAQGRLDAALSSQDVKNVPAMKQQLEALKKDLPAKEKAVADAIAKDNKDGVAVDSPATVAAKKDLATLQTQIKTLSDLIAKAEDNVAKLRGDVAAAAVVRDKACAPPVTPAPTTTPAAPTTVTVSPTTTVAPPPGPVYPTCADAVAAGAAPIALGEPGYRPELDSDNDGVACEPATDTDLGDSGFSQVRVVPQGGVDTGTR